MPKRENCYMTNMKSGVQKKATSHNGAQSRWAVPSVLLASAIVSAFLVRATEKPPVPFADLPGKQEGVAFSPDGTRIAFQWEGGPDGNTAIYVKSMGTGAPLRVTAG